MLKESDSAQAGNANSNVTNFEVDGGQGFSFDEVSNIMSQTAQTKTVEDDESAWGKAEKLFDDSVAEKKEKKAAKAAEIKEEKEAKVAEEVAKMIKAKNGDAEMELAANLLFNQKVDGKDAEVSLQDLLNNYSGKTAWDKKFQQLDSERKSFKGERELIEKYITEFGNKVKDNDAIGAIEYLAQFAGVDALQFRRLVRDSLTPQIQKFLEMDEQQKQMFAQKEELDFLKQRQESEKQKLSEQQSQKELEGKVESFQKTYGLNEEALVQLHDDIAKVYKGEVTLEVMEKVIQSEQRLARAESALSAVDKSLLEVDGNLNQIAELIQQNPDFTDEDLQDIVREAFEKPVKQASKNVSKKVAGKQPTAPAKQESSHKSAIDKILLSFDDL